MKRKYLISLLILFGSSIFWAKAQTTIKMEQSGGVYKIPCKVNGLALKFIFDSGASDVSISLTEALFMLKNEYLSENDIMGTDYHQNANGDIQEGTKVNIRCIEVGGQKIYNVQASITNTVDAPLLFGQSAMQRFGKFSIDYATNSLILGGASNTETAVASTPQKTDPVYQKVCKDIDGNTYKTVKIGTQIWMAENLKTSHFRDGSAIIEIKDILKWANTDQLQTAAWCYYQNNDKNNPTYGKLYNWYAVDDSHNLCPTGWHVPTDEEFQILENFLGGFDKAGGKMKDLSFWEAPNIGATNASDFTALPAGFRDEWGFFQRLGKWAKFWFSSPYDTNNANTCYLFSDYALVNRTRSMKKAGSSVRCVKN